MTKCKKCDLEIEWRKTLGRWYCLNPDGTDHWDRCSEVRTKRAMTEGVPFRDKKGTGYIIDGKKKYFMMGATSDGKPIEVPHFRDIAK